MLKRISPKILPVFALGLLGALLKGCPLESAVPLGSVPDSQINDAILGTWYCDGEALLIAAFDAQQYYLEGQSSGDEPERLAAHESVVGGLRFLNLRPLGSAPADHYTFLSYSLDGGVLLLRTVSDELVPGEYDSPAALSSAVAQAVGQEALFWGDPVECTRSSTSSVTHHED